MLTNLILWVHNLLTATTPQRLTETLSDKEICEAIIATMNNPRNNYNCY